MIFRSKPNKANKKVIDTPTMLQLPQVPVNPAIMEIMPHHQAPAPGLGCAKLKTADPMPICTTDKTKSTADVALYP